MPVSGSLNKNEEMNPEPIEQAMTEFKRKRGSFFRFTCGDRAARLERPLKRNTKVWLHLRLRASLSVACLVCSTQRLFRRQCLFSQDVSLRVHVTYSTETEQAHP